MDSAKKLLAIGGDALLPVLTALSKQGWQAHHVRDFLQLTHSRKLRTASVGLLLLDEKMQRHLEDVKAAMALCDLEWIVLIDRDRLAKPQVCQFIDDSCHDFHCFPVDVPRLGVILGHLRGKEVLRRGLEVKLPEDAPSTLIGEHPTIRQLRQEIRNLARVNVTVMIAGESGTGKELVARLIHQQSPRGSGPFQAVNCAGLPATLVQSELFGCEKGAFTGANSTRVGRIEAAQGGTLFLDEIGDMAIEAQVNLLRFLEEGTIERLGSTQPRAVDARVLSATHVDLPRAVAEGRFREDLYYRLNVCHVRLPALRQRRSDVPLLARHLAEQISGALGLPRKMFSSDAITAMMAHEWPGNIRELKNRISQGLAMAQGKTVRPEDMGLPRVGGKGPASVALDLVREQAEREALVMALDLHANNSSKAARTLGVSRATFYRLLQKYQPESH